MNHDDRSDDHASSHAHKHDHDHDDDPKYPDRHDDGHAEPNVHDHGDHSPDEHLHDDHGHEHGSGPFAFFGALFHSHEHQINPDRSIRGSDEGIRAVQISLVGLAITAMIQLVVTLQSGSVGLLADTIHNFSDALTAMPLWLAFAFGRRPANRRYTYGYGRAEDIAGLAIVGIIVVSALVALWEAYQKLIHPTPIQYVGWVMVAAVVGFLGNEAVAIFRIRTGRRIGSAALEADGQHARVDGLTSLGVLVGAIFVVLGVPVADPIVGILLSVAILLVSRSAAVTMYHRFMDAIDPSLVGQVETTAGGTSGVVSVDDVRLRWHGHRLLAELDVLVNEEIPVREAHAIAEEVRHRLFHALPQLAEIRVHVDPYGQSTDEAHHSTEHHRSGGHGIGTER